MSDIFDDLFGEFMGGRRGRPALRAASAAPTCATTWRSLCRRPTPARRRRSACRPASTCTTCTGTGAKTGTRPSTCPTCGGAGKVRATQGFFTIERTCPACQGRGEIINDPVRLLQRLGPRRQGAHAVGQHPGGRRGRHPHPPCRRRRGRHARRAGRRSLHLPVDQAARVLPARRRRHLLPRADLHDDGGARRPHRRADHRRRARRA